MYTLYSRPGSGGFVVEAALAMAGLPFTVVNVDQAAVDDRFLAISPLGQVPALTLPDGSTITESAAIVLHLSEVAPQAGLAPPTGSPDRPHFLRWMLFMSSVLYPAVLRCYYADRYTADPAAVEGVRAAGLAEMDRGFEIVERALEGRDWLAGDAMTIADIYLVMLAAWHPVADRARPEWVDIVRIATKVQAIPVLASLNANHRLW